MMLDHVETKINYQFKSKDLLKQALTHKSYAFEFQEGLGHNERLEFLGDAVLDLVLAQELMNLFPTDDEGALSKKRASLVNEAVLAEKAIALNLGEFLRLGKGEQLSKGAERPRTLASTYEAVVGAYFLDAGFTDVQKWIWTHFIQKTQELSLGPDFEKDFKTRLQELSQTLYKLTPQYQLLSEEGLSHSKVFSSAVVIGTESWSGQGASKKISEQAAAQLALQDLLKIQLQKGTI